MCFSTAASLAGETALTSRTSLATVRGIEAGAQKAFAARLAPRLEFEVRLEPDEKDPKRIVEHVYWAEPDPAVRLAIILARRALG